MKYMYIVEWKNLKYWGGVGAFLSLKNGVSWIYNFNFEI